MDLKAIHSPPLDVQTDEGGRYDPYAPGAPLTVYASGVRNAYEPDTLTLQQKLDALAGFAERIIGRLR